MSDNSKHRLSPFSIILIMVALMACGAAMIPLLSVQLRPGQTTRSLTVSCSWGGASPTMMENEVVAKLEGVLARLGGVEEMNSVSSYGGGQVSILFKEGTKMEAARFEVASQIRSLYPKLPEGVSYPSLSISTAGIAGSGESEVLGYTINTSLPVEQAERYITDDIMPVLSRIEGVNSVRYGGIRPHEYVVTVDPDIALKAGLTMQQISSAFGARFGEATIGNVRYDDPEGGNVSVDGNVILVKARVGDPEPEFADIPLIDNAGRIVMLGEIATVKYRESLPGSYMRINGLDIVTLSVSAMKKNVNITKLSAEVRAKMKELQLSFPKGFTAELNFDAAKVIDRELQTMFLRTLVTVAILMLFVLAVSRNGVYLLMIFATLLANIFVAVIFYYLLGLQIHLYSLAGIAVSLGIIIDTSIIMVDHYSYYRDRKAFLAILGAVLTTIASLTVVFLLPANQQLVFGDFAWVIIVNLSVSLLISFLFIPALLDKFPLRRPMTVSSARRKRFVMAYNRHYGRFIGWGRRHRWLFIVVLILGFGIPLHKLPTQLKAERGEEPTQWQKFYNKTVGGKLWQDNKGIFEKALGGSFRLFDADKPPTRNHGAEPERITMTIRASMVEGNTVHQLNDIVRHMENFLSGFEEIESFRTSVSSFDNSMINVVFKPEHEKGRFPYSLFEQARREVNKFGGATWSIYGIPNQNFNNNVSSYGTYKPYRITLTGYSYDNLMQYAEMLADSLGLNRRVQEPEIFGEVSWDNSRRKQEFFVEMDRERILMSNTDLGSYFNRLNQLLYEGGMRSVIEGNESRRVTLVSSQRESFDLWHVRNFPIQVDSVRVKLADFGTIDREYTGLNIYKRNQSYQLIVAFDFVGSWELCNRLIKTQVDRLNDGVLPIGYAATGETDGVVYNGKKDRSFLLILLVAAIIYMICAILFESLGKPSVIILMIPVSFIGVFLTFGLFGFQFGEGGFASFILLSGLVVNAGIYVVNEYNLIARRYPGRRPQALYVKAYSRKIVPIILTIVSTVLGLIPFIVDNSGDRFWYSFAVGTMGGMVFSIVALLVYLPLFMPLGRRHSPDL